MKSGEYGEIRTRDPLIKSQMLYRLSYVLEKLRVCLELMYLGFRNVKAFLKIKCVLLTKFVLIPNLAL